MRIAIVNDMVMVVELLKRIVMSAPNHELAWVAYDGAEAVRRCAADTPDLILMDLIMPVMGGVEATQRIMQSTPCAILVVTASVVGNVSKVFEAMGYGALDVTKTPTLHVLEGSGGAQELLHKIDTINRLLGKANLGASTVIPAPRPEPVAKRDTLPPLVVLGASTGGPLALVKILSQLPANFPASVVVIQHVDLNFAEGFVNWLSESCSMPVEVAKSGQNPSAGKILVASTSDHLFLKDDHHLCYVDQPKESVYRPSVDVFFESVAQNWPVKGIGVLLTGMGRDGARGLLALSRCGWQTIAQHRDSCVVYGMPKAAVELNAAGQVLPLTRIASTIISIIEMQFKDTKHAHT